MSAVCAGRTELNRIEELYACLWCVQAEFGDMSISKLCICLWGVQEELLNAFAVYEDTMSG